ncbi:hypothetical protein KAI78_10055 [bacterium]|nr:hypothetical protein [bacterium]
MKRSLLFFAIILLTANLAYGHGSLEFIDLYGAEAGAKGEFSFHVQYDYMVEDKADPTQDHWEFTPGISWGIIEGLTFDIHTHFAKFGSSLLLFQHQAAYEPMGPSPFFEALAVSLQYTLPLDLAFDTAFVVVYEYPYGRSQTLLGGGVVIEGILSLGYDFGTHSNITINVKYGVDDGDSFSEWGLGFKMPLTADGHGISAGIEFMGDFEDINNSWSVLPGIYLPLGDEYTIFKTGLQMGKDLDTMRVNATLLYTF